MVNGKNLTQTKEWKKIYKSEKRKYVSEAGFEQVEDVYAATSANEFFAECFQQYYLAPGTLAKNCPKPTSSLKEQYRLIFLKSQGLFDKSIAFTN